MAVLGLGGTAVLRWPRRATQQYRCGDMNLRDWQQLTCVAYLTVIKGVATCGVVHSTGAGTAVHLSQHNFH